MLKKLLGKTRFKIVAAITVTIFSLASVFSASFAWFAAGTRRVVTAGNFTVAGPEQVGFDIFYLSSFHDAEENEKYGNYNPSIDYFSGYEVDYDDATFTKIEYSDGVVSNSPDPTDIRHLWPAHKLTFAIVVTSSSIEKLSLTDWGENEGHEEIDAAKTSISQFVRLSWAIDIYGAAYSVLSSGSTDEANANDIAAGFMTYRADDSYSDVFDYSEDNLAPINPKDELDIVDSVPSNDAGYKTIVYFTVEFSDADETHYILNESTGFYEQDDDGNSNCYERLFLSKLDFKVI